MNLNYLKKIKNNLSKQILFISIFIYLFFFDQIFYFYNFKIDLRLSLMLLIFLPFIENKYKDYLKIIFYWLIFIAIFYFQSLLKFGDTIKLDYIFFNSKNLIICLFLSLILINIKIIYINFYKIIFLYILSFPLIYLISRFQIFYIFSNDYKFIEILKFTFGNIRTLFIEKDLQSNLLYLFKEQSHFNMIGVFIIINFLINLNKIKKPIILIYSYLSLIFFLVIIIINLSSTFTYGYSLSIILIYILCFNKLNKLFTLSSAFILLTTLYISFNDNKINEITSDLIYSLKNYEKSKIFIYKDDDEKLKKNKLSTYNSINISNLSFEVYLFNLKLSLIAFKENPFGYGLNSYNLVHDKFSNIIPNKNKGSNWLNKTNGSAIFIKSLAEFGIFIILFGVVFAKLILSNKVRTKKKILLLSGLITIIAIRGTGYVNAGFLILFILLINEFINVTYKN